MKILREIGIDCSRHALSIQHALPISTEGLQQSEWIKSIYDI